MTFLLIFVFRLLGGGLLAAAMIAAILLSPVAWIEIACRGEAKPQAYEPILPLEHRRSEARTMLTYPEWHIVHAYDDYAKLIETRDPHEFNFRQEIRGFWTTLCPLNRLATAHGGATAATKATVYTIGVSFTAELLLKSVYEETVGRFAAWWRGPERAPLDDLSARQAAAYADFLQQVPWYKWDFTADRHALHDAATDQFRDRERNFALGTEYRAKAAYAGVIERAVGEIGADELSIRSIVTGLSRDALAGHDDVTVIASRPEGLEIETPRYRAFTHILDTLARNGAEFVEIAGNDDILVTILSRAPLGAAQYSFGRQGYDDTRNLLVVKVADLAQLLRGLDMGTDRLEHIHDY